MSLENVSTKLPAELKARLQVEAKGLGRSLSDHVREILAAHFDGGDMGRLEGQLAEVTDVLQSLVNDVPGRARDGTDTAALLEHGFSAVGERVAELAATVHYALNVVISQHNPSTEHYLALQAAFEKLRAKYRAIDRPAAGD